MNPITIAPDDVANDLDNIESRLQELESQFRLNRRMVAPKRPIKKMSFDPLQIEYARRKYNGNPLSHFQYAQGSSYTMTKADLHKVDPALYAALGRHSQLETAFPGE